MADDEDGEKVGSSTNATIREVTRFLNVMVFAAGSVSESYCTPTDDLIEGEIKFNRDRAIVCSFKAMCRLMDQIAPATKGED